MATVLIVGSGGSEHALARSLADDADVDRVVCAPGNGGTQLMDSVTNEPLSSSSEIAAFAVHEGIDLVVVGPSERLIDGLADDLRRRGLRVFGFGRAGAQLEGSRVHAKRFMGKYGVPTPAFWVFGHSRAALRHLDDVWSDHPEQPLVIRADKPHRERDSYLVRNRNDAERALRTLFDGNQHDHTDRHVIVEERIDGREVSMPTLTDGGTLLSLPPTHVDHRITKAQTGSDELGVGACVPAALLDGRVYDRVESEILIATLDGMHAERTSAASALDVELMIDPKDKPYAVGYNVGFRDPGTQAMMALLASDLYPVLSACADGRLDRANLRWHDGASVTVGLFVEGDPDTASRQREPITGLDEVETMSNVMVDHVGTSVRRGQVVTRGGRVLTVTGVGPDVVRARERTYEAIGQIRFRGMRYRTDIGLEAG